MTAPFRSLEDALGLVDPPPFGSLADIGPMPADVTATPRQRPRRSAGATIGPQESVTNQRAREAIRNDPEVRRQVRLDRMWLAGTASDLFNAATRIGEFIPEHLLGSASRNLRERNRARAESRAGAMRLAAQEEPAGAMARNVATMLVTLAVARKVSPELITPATNLRATRAAQMFQRYGKAGAVDAATFAGYEGTIAAIEQSSPEEIVSRMWGGAAMGATAAPLMFAGAMGAKLLRPAIEAFSRQLVEGAELQRLAGMATTRAPRNAGEIPAPSPTQGPIGRPEGYAPLPLNFTPRPAPAAPVRAPLPPEEVPTFLRVPEAPAAAGMSPELAALHNDPVRVKGVIEATRPELERYLNRLRRLVQARRPDLLPQLDDAVAGLDEGALGLVVQKTEGVLGYLHMDEAAELNYARQAIEAVEKTIPAELQRPAPSAPALNPRGATTLPVATGITGNIAGAAVGGATAPEDATPMERVARITAGAIAGGLAGAALGSGANVAARALRARVGRAIAEIPIQRAAPEMNVAEAMTPAPEARLGGPSRMPQFNLARFSENIQSRVQTRAEQVAATHDLPQTARMTTEELRVFAARLGLDPATLRRTRHWSAQHVIAAGDVLADDVNQMVALQTRLASGDLAAEEVAKATKTLALVDQSIDANLATMMQRGSEAGRTLWAHRVLAQTTLDPATWLTRAARTAGVTALPSEVKANIARLISEGDRQGLATYVAGLKPVSNIAKAWSLWKIGLLSAPTTQIVNAVGNVLMTKLVRASDAVAAMGDYLASNFLPIRVPTEGGKVWRLGTGVRTTTLGGRGQTRAGLLGAQRAINERWTALRTGQPMQGAWPKFEIPRNVDFGPILNVYRDAVLTPLGTMDELFKVPAFYRAVQDRTAAAALTRGLSRAESQAAANATVDYLASGAKTGLRPDDDIILAAIADAEEAVYQNEGFAASILRGVKTVAGRTGGDIARLPFEMVMPFSRTPANIGARIVEFSGGGAVSGAWHAGRLLKSASQGNISPGAQRAMVRSFGRASIGGMMMVAGYYGARHGWIKGAPPSGRSERGTLNLANIPTYAIRAGPNSKTWHDLRRVAPFGSLLAFGASLYEVSHDAQLVAQGKAPGTMLGIAGRQFLEQSALTGMSRALGMLENPLLGGEKLIQSYAGSVVPTLAARTAQGFDPTIRDPQGPLDAVVARLPVLSRALPGRINQLGQEVQRNPSGLFASLLGFTNPRTENTDDPVIAAIARSGARIGELERRSVSDRAAPGGKRPETTEEFRQRSISVGTKLYAALQTLVAAQGFDTLTVDRQRAAIERRRDRIRRQPFAYRSSR